jgi:hypothetical protein
MSPITVQEIFDRVRDCAEITATDKDSDDREAGVARPLVPESVAGIDFDYTYEGGSSTRMSKIEIFPIISDDHARLRFDVIKLGKIFQPLLSILVTCLKDQQIKIIGVYKGETAVQVIIHGY